MKQSRYTASAAAGLVLLIILWNLILPCPAGAQAAYSWWGSASWWDWSDFRAYMGVRLFLPRVTGTVEVRGQTRNLTDYGITNDPELFKSFLAETYVDRLGLRLEVEEDYTFRGRQEDASRVSQLDVTTNKLEVDLELIRYPFARAGANFAYYTESFRFQDRRDSDSTQWYMYTASQPLCIGAHGMAIPGRIRDVPVTIQARVRFPVPFVKRSTETKVTEWEISAGLRPAIWSTSLLGHSTFSLGIEGGYRAAYLDMSTQGRRLDPANPSSPREDVHISARWSGAFVQAVLYY